MQQTLPVALERREAQSIIDAVFLRHDSGKRNRAGLALMLFAGLRVGEVCALRPGHIRWKDGILEVHNGKGGRDRNVPMSPTLERELESWKALRNGSPYFFSTRDDKQMMPRFWQRLIKRMSKRAGIDGDDRRITPHVLRHTFATNCLEDGFTLAEVQAMLGHSNVATTSIYLSVRPHALVEKMRNGDAADQVKPSAENQIEDLFQELEHYSQISMLTRLLQLTRT